MHAMREPHRLDAAATPERPIVMRDWEVRAVLEGRKSQLRLVKGLEAVNQQPNAWESVVLGPLGYMAKKSVKGRFGATFRSHSGVIEARTINLCPQVCPFGQPGDRLWVRETFASFPSTGGLRFYRTGVIYHRPNDPRLLPEHPYREVVYRADGEDVTKEHPNGATSKWRSPVAMPRWASRITLEITSVRVERLQDISEEDAIAEGMTQETADAFMCPEELAVFASAHILCPDSMARIMFETYWDRMHGRGAWDRNPWVAVYGFRPVLANIDAMEG